MYIFGFTETQIHPAWSAELENTARFCNSEGYMLMTFLRKNPMLLWLAAFLGLGFFWFYVMLNPWVAFVSSDDAVPYIQTLTEWRPQDLFYWGTSRMGMLYEVAWKAGLSLFGIRETVLGSALNTGLFYLVHLLLAFCGFAFWLQTLRTRTARWIFFIFFVPVTRQMTEYFLLPGQPYGILFFLTGLFFWYLLEREERRQNHAVLALIIGVLWIQHELSGLTALGVYIFRFQHHRWKTFLPGFVVIVAVGAFCKHEAQKWFGETHYALSPIGTILDGLWFTLRDGYWWISVRRLTGHVVTIAIVAFFVEAWRTRQTEPFWKDSRRVAFFGALVSVVLIHCSDWYVANGRPARYFSSTMPIMVWVFLSRYESLPRQSRVKWIFLAACLIPIYKTQTLDLWLNPVIRAKFEPSIAPNFDFAKNTIVVCDTHAVEESLKSIDPTLVSWSPTWLAEGCTAQMFEKKRRLAEVVHATGCVGYLDDYWNSYVLTMVTNGLQLTSSDGHVRNPELFAYVKTARPLCIMPREETPFQNIISELNLDCIQSPHKFLLCSDKPRESR